MINSEDPLIRCPSGTYRNEDSICVKCKLNCDEIKDNSQLMERCKGFCPVIVQYSKTSTKPIIGINKKVPIQNHQYWFIIVSIVVVSVVVVVIGICYNYREEIRLKVNSMIIFRANNSLDTTEPLINSDIPMGLRGYPLTPSNIHRTVHSRNSLNTAAQPSVGQLIDLTPPDSSVIDVVALPNDIDGESNSSIHRNSQIHHHDLPGDQIDNDGEIFGSNNSLNTTVLSIHSDIEIDPPGDPPENIPVNSDSNESVNRPCLEVATDEHCRLNSLSQNQHVIGRNSSVIATVITMSPCDFGRSVKAHTAENDVGVNGIAVISDICRRSSNSL